MAAAISVVAKINATAVGGVYFTEWNGTERKWVRVGSAKLFSTDYRIAQNSGGGNFGELNAIRQYFTQPNPFNKNLFWFDCQ